MSCNEGGSTSINSSKAVNITRVDPVEALKQFDATRQMGSPLMCPASAIYVNIDSSGRQLGGNAHRMLTLTDPSCSALVYSLSTKLRDELNERPIFSPIESYNRLQGKITSCPCLSNKKLT